MGVEWHPVENSKLASAGASPYSTTFLDKPPTRCILQAGMVSSNSGIEGRMHVQSHVRRVIKITCSSNSAGLYGDSYYRLCEMCGKKRYEQLFPILEFTSDAGLVWIGI